MRSAHLESRARLSRWLAIAALLVGATSCYRPDDTRLTRAILKGDVDAVRSLVEAEKVDPDQRGGAGWTPLTLAIAHDHTSIAKILLDAGASVDRRKNSWTWNLDGTPPLSFAAVKGHAEIAEMLLAAGARVDAHDFLLRATPLMWAAASGDTAIVGRLLASGADIEARARGGWSALHYAAHRNGHRQRSTAATAHLLMEGGADIEAANDAGWTPLHTAALNGNLEVVRALLDAGARAEATDRSGDTVLSKAAAAGEIDIVRELLPLFRNDAAALDQAISDARRENHAEVARLLGSWQITPRASDRR